MICPNCSKDLQGNFRFCPHCGAPTTQKLFCPGCGKEGNTEWAICPYCGSKYHGTPQTHTPGQNVIYEPRHGYHHGSHSGGNLFGFGSHSGRKHGRRGFLGRLFSS